MTIYLVGTNSFTSSGSPSFPGYASSSTSGYGLISVSLSISELNAFSKPSPSCKCSSLCSLVLGWLSTQTKDGILPKLLKKNSILCSFLSWSVSTRTCLETSILIWTTCTICSSFCPVSWLPSSWWLYLFPSWWAIQKAYWNPMTRPFTMKSASLSFNKNTGCSGIEVFSQGRKFRGSKIGSWCRPATTMWLISKSSPRITGTSLMRTIVYAIKKNKAAHSTNKS